MYSLPCLGTRATWLTGWKENFFIPNVSKIFDWRYFYTNKPSMSTVFSVKENCGKEQNGRNVLIWKIWRFLSMGEKKKRFLWKLLEKTVNVFLNIFVYMKVFICFPLVPSSGKCFSATFPRHSFLFKSHISPSHSSTLWLWNPILFFTCSLFYNIFCFLKVLFSFEGESEGSLAVLHQSGILLNSDIQ